MFPLCIVFAVDQVRTWFLSGTILDETSKITVIYRTQHGSLVKLTFLEFTTSTLHPLSSEPPVWLPSYLVLDVAYASGESSEFMY